VPEGDTVWLTAKRLHGALAGRVLTHTDFRVPALATADLRGASVVETVSRGKHLLTRFDTDLTLHTHLRMDGAWRRFRTGAPWRGGPDWQVRVVLANAEWAAVGYRLPVVELLPTRDEARVVGHLGPDLLGPDWDPDEAVRRLAARPEREIGPALLDQRNLAGIGNLYKAESLFLAGVTPWAAVADVDLAAVTRIAHRLLAANRDHWEQSTTGNLRAGEQHWVFERSGRPCRRCGTRIRSAVQSEPDRPAEGRLTYWCPACQAGPGPVAEAGKSRTTPDKPGPKGRY
jgi:endonuclease-8